MKKKTIFRRVAAGLALAGAVTIATILIVLSVTNAAVPSINFKCLKFNLMDDGTIQAVVTVSAENVPHMASTEFSINYNDKYIRPSDAETNTLLPMGETQAFFEQDSQLYRVKDGGGNPVSPFLTNPTGTSGGLKLGLLGQIGTEKLLSMALYLDKDTIARYGAADKIERLPTEEGGPINVQSLPGIMADGTVEDGKGAVIGTISFRVDPDNLTEMVQKFSAGGTIPDPAPGEKPYLLGLSKKLQGNDVWVVAEHHYDPDFASLEQRLYTATTPRDMKINFLFTFPGVLVKAVPAVKEVTVSAYEAYTDGTSGDVAAVLRKHSPTVRAGYADGTFKDFLLPWGTADVGAEYHVYEMNGDGTKGAEVTAYDPKGGKYLIQQNFFYEEEDDAGTVVTKKFPLPMEVKLTVAPVTAQGITGDSLHKTYLNATGGTATEAVPAFFSKLGLPNVATLVVSRAPGTTSLTLPLETESWSNYSADLSGTVSNDAVPVNWPVDPDVPGQIAPDIGAGTYQFTYTLTQAKIQAAYPWLSGVAASYTLNASRVIEINQSNFIDPSHYAVTAARAGAGPENAEFTVTKNGAALTAGDTLTLYLPSGQVVDPADYDVVHGAATVITTTADDATDTELRRYLNLGGWFAVGIQEDNTANPSAEIPAYLAPRDNLYLEDRIGQAADSNPGRFDFTGYLAGLFPYTSAKVLGNTVVLPVGYSVKTTYDGMNGAPAGDLSTVKANWGVPASNTETGLLPGQPDRKLDTYGPKPYEKAWFDGYGQVKNDGGKQVEIRVEDQAAKSDSLSVSLTCAPGTQGAAISGGQVTGVVYNTRQKGYRARQEFTLTLKNTGTRDIYGLSLELPANNHFEIIKAPAAYLAAGMETTFVVTYLYDLKPVLSTDTGITFKDTIHIVTNETGGASIKSFTAQFRVTNGPVSTVKVVTNFPLPSTPPTTPAMGDAGIIVGLGEGVPADSAITDGAASGTDLPDSTGGPTDYEENYKYVWVRSKVYDEYEIGEVYYYRNNVQTADNKVPLMKYDYTGTNAEGTKSDYWFFKMPNDDVTVHVDFIEPILSKLRLSAILPEAHVNAGSMSARDLRRWDDNKITTNNGDPLTTEESGLDHFLVVLGANDVQAQLTLKLRKVLAVIPGLNEDIPVHILVREGAGNTILNDSGSTDGVLNGLPNQFTTAAFTAPDPGNSTDVVITLSYNDAGATVSRSFTVTFAKPPETVAYVLGYGNSPYGMIMSDAVLTNNEKVTAKADFDANRTFTPGLMPVKAAGLTNVYSAGAWNTKTDYDRDETALFVYSGESFLDPGTTQVQDSANKPVPGENISRTLSVKLLDKAAGTQAGRFSGAETVSLDLGTADTALVENWWKDADNNDYLIRPGVYEIIYTFQDYDGTTAQSFTRPLIILPRNGDVNADMAVDETDAKVIEGRVTDPMGYTADEADYPDWRVFRYRVCDVNNDRNFNNIDANLVRDKEKIVFFYLPINYK